MTRAPEIAWGVVLATAVAAAPTGWSTDRRHGVGRAP